MQRLEVRPGVSIRYLRLGRGQPLLLLHTIRTQLEYFERLAPLLADRYTVYVLDLPGHGESTIEHVDHTEERFRRAVINVIEKLDLRDVVIAGESIGGVLALTVAAQIPQRIARVVSINPYDYGDAFGGGIRRTRSGWIVALFALFRQFTIEPRFLLNRVLAGGFRDPRCFPESLARKFFTSGQRAGYRWVEYSVFANWRSWIEARKHYPAASVPVTLVYSEFDWSTAADRRRTQAALPKARMVTVPDAGHFSSLEAPREIAAVIAAE